jgi:hypothetical protein
MGLIIPEGGKGGLILNPEKEDRYFKSRGKGICKNVRNSGIKKLYTKTGWNLTEPFPPIRRSDE